ncbi:hypothetical protein BDW22DRAFT_209005 [Trametopsis cervina]|nr:hypothetical protein BDW22DRAFT_209005 [Trametopsis cervina]
MRAGGSLPTYHQTSGLRSTKYNIPAHLMRDTVFLSSALSSITVMTYVLFSTPTVMRRQHPEERQKLTGRRRIATVRALPLTIPVDLISIFSAAYIACTTDTRGYNT